MRFFNFFLFCHLFTQFFYFRTGNTTEPDDPNNCYPIHLTNSNCFLNPLTASKNCLCYDLCFSPYAGAEDLLFGLKFVELLETNLLIKKPSVYSDRAIGKFARLTELITFWLPVNYLTVVVQHEVFGHGYRIRDLNTRGLAEVDKYSIGVPPPYGPGGGSTSFYFSRSLSTSESSAISIAGVEASSILAQITKLKWLSNRTLDPRQAFLYLFSQQDLTLYIESLSSYNRSGHDISSYLKTLNYTYPQTLLTQSQLKALVWVNLADPFTFYSIFSLFYYIDKGKEISIPMIQSVYLPGFHLGLTPFGPEIFLDNYYLFKEEPLYWYIKGGYHGANRYYGLGLFVPQCIKIWRWSLGMRADFWKQPTLLLEPGAIPISKIPFSEPPSPDQPLYPSSLQHQTSLGGAVSLIGCYHANDQCGYELELGGKTQGFLPGYSLYAAPTIRVSIYFTF